MCCHLYTLRRLTGKENSLEEVIEACQVKEQINNESKAMTSGRTHQQNCKSRLQAEWGMSKWKVWSRENEKEFIECRVGRREIPLIIDSG